MDTIIFAAFAFGKQLQSRINWYLVCCWHLHNQTACRIKLYPKHVSRQFTVPNNSDLCLLISLITLLSEFYLVIWILIRVKAMRWVQSQVQIILQKFINFNSPKRFIKHKLDFGPISPLMFRICCTKDNYSCKVFLYYSILITARLYIWK